MMVRSLQSDTPGIVRHSLAWILEECRDRGLALTELPGLDCDAQYWLRIERAGP